ncbi:hypothetical protein DK419_04515 [Methylobacterium terrae]|uniref:Uncharacterized protein n=1 Tax=Methylobacterium terrae TaxID=2202827 RepID=A0A2U8WHH2_9HYPH|nr:hypothetical protein [Methylobacterium terrae]AWN45675.1 hypothetical protein DK419_04515 [Methylobacterium terrae]
MAASCPIPTPEQAQYAAILARAADAMRAAMTAALAEAARASAAELAAAGSPLPAPAEAYFAAVAHQALYCRLCGADPRTFSGGDPDRAAALLRNGRNIARHHWGMKEPGWGDPA